MEVQVFGTRKCADTRKAIRFFSERRVKTHFVDLKERAASRREILRFSQKFGVASLIDQGSQRFEELGLRQAHYGEARWIELLEEEPLLLETPLVRRGSDLTVGAAEEAWCGWTSG